ncbi:nucleotidyltransferase substrate binding protein [Thioploca ingrica]|uniref:Nucleotidyltransferase substrate binding protein n=1 Tax=Thioploca ingrica TaxID=40754 RepID=A0A090AKX8_9GAMM|nr:nucleotidyltransferase substrate binding protein [Thioploca ingrica]
MLDLTNLEKALRQFKKTLLFCEAEPDGDKQVMLQTAAIQCFEYTYELAIKMLRRSLEERLPSHDALSSISFNDLIRLGAEQGLIDNPSAWFGFRHKRNITAHTYDESKAEEIYAILPEVVNKTDYLLQQLKRAQ